MSFFACCCGSLPPCSTFTIRVCVKHCPDATSPVSAGVIVSLTGPGPTALVDTTDSFGCVTFSVANTGTYTATSSTASVDIVVVSTVCSYNAGLCVGDGASVCVRVGGCFGIFADSKTVTIKNGATTVASGAAAGSPGFCACVPPNTLLTLEATDPTGRHDPGTATITSGAKCGNPKFGLIFLPAAAAYACLCVNDCVYAVSKTLYITEDVYGSTTTLNYNATTGKWEGSSTVAYPGCPDLPYFPGSGCPAQDFTLYWWLGGGDPSGCYCPVTAGFESATGRPECPGTNATHATINAGSAYPYGSTNGAFGASCNSTVPFTEGTHGWGVDSCPTAGGGSFTASGRLYLVNQPLSSRCWSDGTSCDYDQSIVYAGHTYYYRTAGFTITE